MKLKKVFITSILAAAATLALASCGNQTHNTVTPYGELNSYLNNTVASANDGEYELTLKDFYNQLRKNSNNILTNNIKKAFYQTEYEALKIVYANETYASLSADDKKTVDSAYLLYDDDSTTPLFTLDEEVSHKNSDGSRTIRTKYEELRETLLEELNKAISTAIFSSSSLDTVKKKDADDIKAALDKYIDTIALIGIDATTDDIEYTLDTTASSYYLDDTCEYPCFSTKTIDLLTNVTEATYINQAGLLSAKKALYKIADEEYIYDEDEGTQKKNSNYIFKDSQIESRYNSTYKTYGSYKVMVIQFNSRREAEAAIKAVGQISTDDKDAALETYVEIYKNYYKYKTEETFSVDEFKASTEEPFYYQVSKDGDELSDINSSIKSLIQDDLEDGEYLLEARNISNKYVLVYRYETEYEYSEADGDQLDWGSTEMTDETKEDLTKKIKEDLINSQASSYQTTNFENLIEEACDNGNLKIYDPLMEYNFMQSYSDYYEYISDSVSNTDDKIFELTTSDGKTHTFTVKDFYTEAALQYQNTIITNYFELAYAYSYYDEFVEASYIDDDLHSDNADTLSDAISTFTSNKNSSYPSYLGEETYLLLQYGYSNYDDVLKYYYDAKQALSVYNSLVVFTEWASESTDDDGNVTYVIADEAKEEGSILDNILNTGNANYSTLFSINIDHILVNIDDDGDGSPDDPDEFLEKLSDEAQASFENAVIELLRAIYTEAIYIYNNYDESTYKDILDTIKTRYNLGLTLLSDTTKTWDDYKSEYPFLLTVESLGDITQSSVSNFVDPFKEYIKNLYTYASSKLEDSYDQGAFVFIDTTTYDSDEIVGYFGGTDESTDASASKITLDTVCKTEYGYHLLVMNSYEVADSTKYTSSDDTLGIQSALEIVLRSYTDNDDNEQEVTIITDSYNSYSTKASFNQLFIYYVQKLNSQTNSLDSDVYSIINTLFNDVIEKYTSSDFKEWMLLNKINSLTVEINFEMFDVKLTSDLITKKIKSLAGSITGYDSESDYIKWVDGTYTWVRPDGR